jgi:hypothetical protein
MCQHLFEPPRLCSRRNHICSPYENTSRVAIARQSAQPTHCSPSATIVRGTRRATRQRHAWMAARTGFTSSLRLRDRPSGPSRSTVRPLHNNTPPHPTPLHHTTTTTTTRSRWGFVLTPRAHISAYTIIRAFFPQRHNIPPCHLI